MPRAAMDAAAVAGVRTHCSGPPDATHPGAVSSGRHARLDPVQTLERRQLNTATPPGSAYLLCEPGGRCAERARNRRAYADAVEKTTLLDGRTPVSDVDDVDA